ncbi:MAG: hypothetical protein FJ298_07745 [Planctomycetes bacterium]|nr:hypothetical protein [Planctomycetota bacterium]
MKKQLVLALVALVLAGSTALAALQEGRREAPGRERTEQGARRDRDGARQRRHGRRRQGRRERRDGLGERIRERIREHLDITEQQRAQGRAVAKEVAPIAEETRTKAREILERARDLRDGGDREGAKALLRAELRPLLEATRARILPLTRSLIDALTVEQRGKIEDFLARRGRSFDADRAAVRLGWHLSRRR